MLSGGHIGPRAQVTRSPLHSRGEDFVAPDHHLVQADFVGVVRVRDIVAPQAGVVTVIFDVLDSWYARRAVGATLRVGIAESHWGEFRTRISPNVRHIVLLSGGPWEASPFTWGNRSLFTIERDDTIACDMSTTLFDVSVGGFLCSIQAYVATPPIRLADARLRFLRARENAAARLDTLDRRLASLQRPLMSAPTAAALIDRTLPENEVRR